MSQAPVYVVTVHSMKLHTNDTCSSTKPESTPPLIIITLAYPIVSTDWTVYSPPRAPAFILLVTGTHILGCIGNLENGQNPRIFLECIDSQFTMLAPHRASEPLRHTRPKDLAFVPPVTCKCSYK